MDTQNRDTRKSASQSRQPLLAKPLSLRSRLFSKTLLVLAGVLAAVTLIYGAHVNNAFHFDDSHTIVENPYLRDLHNLPRFFADTEMSSVLPPNRSYRPVLFASLAIDYWLGHGLAPFWFHVSTLLWFLVEVWLIFVLSRRIFDRISPQTANAWPAVFAAALYGLHPVMSETVNYVIQRAELQSTLGVVAGFVIYICFPGLRKFGLYLAPVAIGILAKPVALVFPVLLFLYLAWIEEERWSRAFVRLLPSIALTVVLGILSAKMTPPSFNPGAASPWGYRISQPLAMLRYFAKFFVPTGLSADTDHAPLRSLLDDGGIEGMLFLAALIGAILWTSRRRDTRPVAFGLAWFLVALFPTSIMALAEVENDHRMFFPFVGLAIAAPWTLALVLRRRPLPRTVVVPACLLLLAGFGYGAWQRCEVWKTDESLWRDVTLKSPHNGRGLMNYGLSLMARGDYPEASAYFERAAAYLPDYYILEINRGIINGAMQRPAEAEKHFGRALALAPREAGPKYFYARWLNQTGRYAQAAGLLQASIEDNPTFLDSYYLLMQTNFDLGNTEAVREVARQTLARFPSDPVAQNWLARPGAMTSTPESWLSRSMALYGQGKYADCIDAARKALELRPGYAEAWNNISAAYSAQGKWKEGIEAGEMAVKLSPENQLAKNNLAWARTGLAKSRSRISGAGK